MTEEMRQPIVTVAGHVDHGKTTILDSIRKTRIYESEAGGITQKISFTNVPMEFIKKSFPAINKKNVKLDIPGFLFIDTPGHAAFSHLRKRGGSLADLAILVIDINEGIMSQTKEVIDILRLNKTPFIIALNKIDNISGWKKQSEDLKDSVDKQALNVRNIFQEKLFTIITSLYHQGFNAKPFYEITNFSKELALIPCSGKTGEGIEELILMLSGISQKFLKQNLMIGKDAKGVILELKKEKDIMYYESILYDGKLKAGDEIAIASFSNPIIAKIRVLEEIIPISSKFKTAKEVTATNGIRIQFTDNIAVLPGMPFTILKDNLKNISEEFKKELNILKTDKKGIIIKADSLGSLEALITLLKQEKISIVSAGIGKINKKDLISAEKNLNEDPINAAILAFNVEEEEEVKEMTKNSKFRIIKNQVIYKLIEELIKFKEEKNNEIKREKLSELAPLCKLKIFHDYVFRNSNPAVFGVRIESGKLSPKIHLINELGESIAKVKSIQEQNQTIQIAEQGKEIAVSLPGIMFDRLLKDTDYLYSDLTESQFKKLKENKELLTKEELQTLQKIAQIKRREKATWGV